MVYHLEFCKLENLKKKCIRNYLLQEFSIEVWFLSANDLRTFQLNQNLVNKIIDCIIYELHHNQ